MKADDSIAFHDPAEYLSGELPILYINTDDSIEVTSKDYYIKGSYYLDANGVEGYKSIGSAANPYALEIKGRGNTTWNYAKKPYRIKLDKKAPLLGMNKNKHFVLLNHIENKFATFQDEMGFELSRRIGLEWTPRHLPVELVFNGDYRGLYMLAEKIRVDDDRVSIIEQRDGETDPELITGGWLVEIDNFDEEGQIRGRESNGSFLRYTYHSPEVLSEEQHAYLRRLCRRINSTIYCEDKYDTEWEKVIDIDALARFYLVNEILGNVEAFIGSCYWHKERGADTKIVFGPVWDFGASFSYSNALANEDFIYNVRPNSHFIGELMKFPNMIDKVQRIWHQYSDKLYNGLEAYLTDWCTNISNAGKSDHRRWSGGWNHNVLYYKKIYMNYILQKRDFLNDAFQALVNDGFQHDDILYKINEEDSTTARVVTHFRYDTDGLRWNYDSLYNKDVTIASTVTIDEDTCVVTKIGRKAFADVGLNSVTIPNTIEEIGDYSFAYDGEGYQNSLEDLSFPLSVKVIGKDAFAMCGTQRVHVPSIEWLCNLDIRGATRLLMDHAYDLYDGDELVEYMDIPDDVDRIRENTFTNCRSIKMVEFPKLLNLIEKGAFSNCTGLAWLSFPEFVSEIGMGAFRGCTSLNYANMTEALIEEVKDSTYYGCTNLSTIMLPQSLKTIGVASFSGTSLEAIELPRSLKTIEESAFAATNLSTVYLCDSITKLGANAFNGTRLQNVLMGSIENRQLTIGDYAMGNCEQGLQNIKLLNSDPESVVLLQQPFYESTNDSTILWVPKGSVEKYRAIDAWNTVFSDIREYYYSDINYDGVADVRDVTCIINELLGDNENTDESTDIYGHNIYDVNFDGVVDVRDLTFAIGEVLDQW